MDRERPSQDKFPPGHHGTVDSTFPEPAALLSTPPPRTGSEGSATKESGCGPQVHSLGPSRTCPSGHLGVASIGGRGDLAHGCNAEPGRSGRSTSSSSPPLPGVPSARCTWSAESRHAPIAGMEPETRPAREGSPPPPTTSSGWGWRTCLPGCSRSRWQASSSSQGRSPGIADQPHPRPVHPQIRESRPQTPLGEILGLAPNCCFLDGHVQKAASPEDGNETPEWKSPSSLPVTEPSQSPARKPRPRLSGRSEAVSVFEGSFPLHRP